MKCCDVGAHRSSIDWHVIIPSVTPLCPTAPNTSLPCSLYCAGWCLFYGKTKLHEYVLKEMPPVVSAEEVELDNHGDERRSRWREQKQSELNCSVWQTQEAIDRARTAHQYNNMQ